MTLFAAGAHAFIEQTINGRPNKGWSWHFRKIDDDNFTLSDLGTLGAYLVAFLNGTIKTYLGNTVVFTRIQLRALHTIIPPVVDYTSGLPITCSGSASVSPGNVCFCVKKSTNLGGPGFRGRTYISGIPEAVVDNANILTDTFVANVLDALNQLKDDIVADLDMQLCVAHGVSGGVPLTEGTLTPVAEWVAVDKRVDTQRRRLK